VELVYVGPHDGVELVVDGQRVEVARGGTLTVPDADAPGLLAQPTNWQPAGHPPAEAEDAPQG